MKVIIYARVSTDDKDQDPERQLLKCRQYCDLHNHEIIKEITDFHTGDSDLLSRPEGSKILDHDPEGIIVFSIDRLSRQHPSKILRFMSLMKDRSIKIISITEAAFNMEGEFSDIIIYIMTWFNNYYLIKLKRDIKSGLDRARSQGKTLGRPKRKINKFRVEQLRSEGRSYSEISKELGIPKATVFRCFKNLDQNNAKLFINNQDVSKSDDLETKEANK